ncbi:hypothetical protein OXW37_02545, partial [Campylobacter hepaticus]|nr:hypothetical protein [Campylobacter hepaticus]MDX2371578.1 hypothetical protein [Campylobacter hepaticus]MDX5508736.1 hypothetical protein [Campylobacter hepaticus]
MKVLIVVFINTFINTGLISGVRTFRDITYLINTGTIKSTTTDENYAAIDIRSPNATPVNVQNLIDTGSLDSQSQGILIETRSSITNLYNNGTIKAQKDGITFISEGKTNNNNNIKIENIILGKNSDIQATKNAINVDVIGDFSTQTSVSIGLINIQEGAKVSGGQAGIKIGQSQEAKSSNGAGKDNTVGQIIVAGEVKGGSEGGIVNEGTIKADANGKSRKRRSLDESQQSDEESKAAILIKESGQITSSNGYGIVNKAMIDGSIISKSSSNISLDNQNGATISGGITNSGYNISNEGSGSVNITSWTIRTGSNNKLQTLTVGGKSANSVMVGN